MQLVYWAETSFFVETLVVLVVGMTLFRDMTGLGGRATPCGSSRLALSPSTSGFECRVSGEIFLARVDLRDPRGICCQQAPDRSQRSRTSSHQTPVRSQRSRTSSEQTPVCSQRSRTWSEQTPDRSQRSRTWSEQTPDRSQRSRTWSEQTPDRSRRSWPRPDRVARSRPLHSTQAHRARSSPARRGRFVLHRPGGLGESARSRPPHSISRANPEFPSRVAVDLSYIGRDYVRSITRCSSPRPFETPLIRTW
jgi:hypothetical protein